MATTPCKTEVDKVCDDMGKCVACVTADNCDYTACQDGVHTAPTKCNSGMCESGKVDNCKAMGMICQPDGCAPCMNDVDCGPPQGNCQDKQCSNGTCVVVPQGSGCLSPMKGTCDKSHTCVARKYVFVTSMAVFSKLNGTAGADDTCAVAAKSAGLGGTWMSWTSDNGSSPSARFTHSLAPYMLLDDMTTVAMSWTALIGGPLKKPISLTETQALVTEPLEVWTATAPSGDYTQSSCNDWNPGNGISTQATVGMADSTDIGWTDANFQACVFTAHLYCFQQ